MDMSADGDGSFLARLFSGKGATAVANVFVMEWAAIWKDLLGGLLIAGAIGAWVPDSFWQGLFLEDSGLLSAVWGPIIGPIVGGLIGGALYKFGLQRYLPPADAQPATTS